MAAGVRPFDVPALTATGVRPLDGAALAVGARPLDVPALAGVAAGVRPLDGPALVGGHSLLTMSSTRRDLARPLIRGSLSLGTARLGGRSRQQSRPSLATVAVCTRLTMSFNSSRDTSRSSEKSRS